MAEEVQWTKCLRKSIACRSGDEKRWGQLGLSLDHIVHFLYRTPMEATEQFRQKGYHAVAGGRHTMWGTWNSLSYFGLSYVEFLAVEQTELAKQSENPLIRQLVEEQSSGEGLGQIALRTQEMDQWATELREKGLHVTGPVAGSRTREDGTVIRWRMLFLEDPSGGRMPPFLIEWQESDDERVKDLTYRGMIADHPNGADGIQAVGYAVAELEEAAKQWERWFGWESSDLFIDEQMGARCRSFKVPGGDIVLCQPIGEGMAREALETRGERPFFVRVCGTNREGSDTIFGGAYLGSVE
ncbi:VOC family protein [Brevibacillus choshinensis]|uniref:VOC family protein n=1 Tax=Brevibacillus choshinensis TaxID=54911 RepID=UPI002E24E145|nr:VOC family protein [Brevibacillus choshinensis]